jgi:sugar phosphate isomerase/epimerase
MINGSMTVGEWAAAASRIGLDGIDISIAMVKSHSPVYLAEFRQMAGRLPLIMAAAYPDFTHPDPIQRRRELRYFESDIALCSQLGIRYLRMLAGQAHPETSRADGIVWALENMRCAADTARSFGMVLLYENHSKPSAWTYVDFSYPIDIFLEIYQGLQDTDVRLNFDIGNISALGLDPLAILPQVFLKIETIHVSDMQAIGRFAPVAIGTGAVPICEVFGWLKKRGFAGWLCIEEASNQGMTGIKNAVDFVRDAWNKA